MRTQEILTSPWHFCHWTGLNAQRRKKKNKKYSLSLSLGFCCRLKVGRCYGPHSRFLGAKGPRRSDCEKLLLANALVEGCILKTEYWNVYFIVGGTSSQSRILMYLAALENINQRQFRRTSSRQNQNMTQKQEIKSKSLLYFHVLSASWTC